MNMKIISQETCEYAMVKLYEKEIVLHYVGGSEIALSYVFDTQEEADEAYRYCVDQMAECEQYIFEWQEKAHRNKFTEYMAEKGTHLMTY